MQLSQKLKSMIYHIIVQYIVEKGDWNPFGQEEISRQINNVSDFFFSMTKILAGVTDYAIENLFQLDVINDFADKIGDFVGIYIKSY
ncbi:putative mating channel protein [Staphylococcus aureus]|nr:putative mating channel protein [Staphylococcus aureus]